MKKILKLIFAVFIWLLYEGFLDGSGMGMKERWNKIKAMSEERRVTEIK